MDLALPPPPDFQDNLEEPLNNEPTSSPDQITIVQAPTRTRIAPSSLTPDDLSQYIKKETPKKWDNSILRQSVNKERNYQGEAQTPTRTITATTSTRAKFDHSTPSSHIQHHTESLGFSPIKIENNYIVEPLKLMDNVCLTSSFSRQTPSRHTIMTSTPKQKSILNYVRPSSSQTNDNEDLLPQRSPKTKPCIACTRLSSTQISSITQMTNRKLATYSTVYSTEVTHMIVAVDTNNCLKDYTVKFVAAVAAGIWVLRYEWVQECLNHNCIVPEVST